MLVDVIFSVYRCFEAIKQVSGGRSADDVRKFIEEKLLSDGRKKERRNAVIW